jgi:hypothetical protein
MEDKILEELLAEHPIQDMVKFSELDIQEKLQDNVGMIVRYRDLYHKELSRLDTLNDMMEKLIGMRYKYYRFDCEDEYTKPEIEKYAIPADEKIIRMKKIIRKQEIKVRFFEMAWKAFEKQSWSMKMFLDTLKSY